MGGTYFVYLLASGRNGTLYIGVTNDVTRRVSEHKAKEVPGFTRKYGVDKLMWFEVHSEIGEAIRREKRIKRWHRDWTLELFRESNPDCDGLYPGVTKAAGGHDPPSPPAVIPGLTRDPSRHPHQGRNGSRVKPGMTPRGRHARVQNVN